jgi:hypothetical protein
MLTFDSTQRTGYFLAKESILATAVELMNETPNNLTGILTIDYEFVPASPFPPLFKNLTSVWLDVGGCGSSDKPSKPNDHFTLTMSSPWEVSKAFLSSGTAHLVSAGGHLHDGGTHIEIIHNDATICDSTATYGATSGYVEPTSGMQHISNMSLCGSKEFFGEDSIVRAGDKFSLRAHYNTSAHDGMYEADGSLAPVMGIGVLYFTGEGKD